MRPRLWYGTVKFGTPLDGMKRYAQVRVGEYVDGAVTCRQVSGRAGKQVRIWSNRLTEAGLQQVLAEMARKERA